MTKSDVMDWGKYGRSIYEHYCQCNDITPYWNGLKIEEQECWKGMSRIVVAEYRSDEIEHKFMHRNVEYKPNLPW